MRQRQKAEGQRYLTAKQLQDVLCRQALELRDRRQAEVDQRIAEEWNLLEPEETIKHGLVATYTHKRCRCQDCTKAMRDYKRSRVVANHPTTAQGSDS